MDSDIEFCEMCGTNHPEGEAHDKELPVPMGQDDRCDACEDHGYFASSTDSPEHPPVEIESCDQCGKIEGDDAAAVAFVRELELGDQWAINQLAQVLDSDQLDDALAIALQIERRLG